MYRQENASFRDMARPLTEVRDARVLIDSLNGLAGRFPGQAPAGAFNTVRRVLKARREEVRRRVLGAEDVFAEVKADLSRARRRVKDWPVGRGWSALRRGL
jgi:hypothetical protein